MDFPQPHGAGPTKNSPPSVTRLPIERTATTASLPRTSRLRWPLRSAAAEKPTMINISDLPEKLELSEWWAQQRARSSITENGGRKRSTPSPRAPWPEAWPGAHAAHQASSRICNHLARLATQEGASAKGSRPPSAKLQRLKKSVDRGLNRAGESGLLFFTPVRRMGATCSRLHLEEALPQEVLPLRQHQRRWSAQAMVDRFPGRNPRGPSCFCCR